MQTKQLIKIRASDNPAQKDHETSPLIRQETTILYYKRHSDDEETKNMYDSFLSDFSIFLVKLPSMNMKKWAQIAYDRQVVLLGHQLNGTQIGMVDKIWINNGKLLGIVIDNTSIGLDPNPPNGVFQTANIDKAVATAYHGMIRAAINLEFDAIRKDKDIAESLVRYIRLAYLRALSMPNLDDIQIAVFDYIMAYNISRFVMLQSHGLALSFAARYIKSEYVDSAPKALDIISSVEVAFKQIKNMREMGRLFRLLDISTDNDSKHISQMVNKLGTLGFITLTGPVDYAVAGVIMSIYSKEYSKLLFDKVSQISIERAIEPYLKKIKFGAV